MLYIFLLYRCRECPMYALISLRSSLAHNPLKFRAETKSQTFLRVLSNAWIVFRVTKIKFRFKYCFVFRASIAIGELNHFQFRYLSREGLESSRAGFSIFQSKFCFNLDLFIILLLGSYQNLLC